MSAERMRAQLLRERGRHDEAVAILLSHLARHPEDAGAFIELALNRMEIPGQVRLALDDAKSAAGKLPDESFPLALQARILVQLERAKEALPLVESAIALDPDCGFSWNSKCLTLIGLSRWKEAEDSARTALELDADDEFASNLLAHALRMQNRLAESEDESRRRLARNPEDAFSFANAGWAALQRGDVKSAESRFREALRIDPQLEHARDGLKQSYRARSAFFRLFLKWSFFMQRFSSKHQFAIIIGLILGFRMLRSLAASVHPLLVLPVALAYYLFVFGAWLAGGMANFLLLRDPVARLSLDRGEKLEGGAIGLLFLGGLLALAAGAALGMLMLIVAGAVMMIAALPASLVFTNRSRPGQAVFAGITLLILGLGAVMAVDVANHPDQPISQGAVGEFSTAVILLGVGSTWLGMVPALRKDSN